MVGYHIIHPDDAGHMLSWLIMAVGRSLVSKQCFDCHSLESEQEHCQHAHGGGDEEETAHTRGYIHTTTHCCVPTP